LLICEKKGRRFRWWRWWWGRWWFYGWRWWGQWILWQRIL